MNWEMLSAVGQLTTVLIGIPSLIYLAVQIREQTKERRQTAVHALTAQWGDLTKAVHESVEFSELYLRGVQPFSDCPCALPRVAPEKVRLAKFCQTSGAHAGSGEVERG
jgi:hypothetical protein